jgi:hypothetical protein
MRELRMPKGWKHVGTNVWFEEKTDAEKRAHQRKVNRIMRNCKKLSADELIKEGEQAEIAKNARKASYDAAKREGKLWTKAQKDAAKAAKKLATRNARLGITSI